MKFKAQPIKSKPGHFAVFQGKKYFTATVTTDERLAKINALEMSGRWYQDQIDRVDSELHKLGALDENDPHGYLC